MQTAVWFLEDTAQAKEMFAAVARTDVQSRRIVTVVRHLEKRTDKTIATPEGTKKNKAAHAHRDMV